MARFWRDLDAIALRYAARSTLKVAVAGLEQQRLDGHLVDIEADSSASDPTVPSKSKVGTPRRSSRRGWKLVEILRLLQLNLFERRPLDELLGNKTGDPPTAPPQMEIKFA